MPAKSQESGRLKKLQIKQNWNSACQQSPTKENSKRCTRHKENDPRKKDLRWKNEEQRRWQIHEQHFTTEYSTQKHKNKRLMMLKYKLKMH